MQVNTEERATLLAQIREQTEKATAAFTALRRLLDTAERADELPSRETPTSSQPAVLQQQPRYDDHPCCIHCDPTDRLHQRRGINRHFIPCNACRLGLGLQASRYSRTKPARPVEATTAIGAREALDRPCWHGAINCLECGPGLVTP